MVDKSYTLYYYMCNKSYINFKKGVFNIALTEAQKRANKKYNEKNKEQKYYNSCKATCKLFINKKGTKEDLLDMYELLKHRLETYDNSVLIEVVKE